MPVNLGHQLALGGRRERREFGVDRRVMDLRRIGLACAIFGGLQLSGVEFCTETKEAVSANPRIPKLTAHAGRHAPEDISIGRKSTWHSHIWRRSPTQRALIIPREDRQGRG